MKKSSSLPIGWREWCGFPGLQIPKIKAKIDTGARTSALHAFNITPFKKGEKSFVRFEVHPVQRNRKISITCEAEVADERTVKNSGGTQQKRYVIRTPITVGERSWEIELTLTNRDSMGFRMLLGREALRKRVVIYPGRSFLQGRTTALEVKTLYRTPPVFLY